MRGVKGCECTRGARVLWTCPWKAMEVSADISMEDHRSVCRRDEKVQGVKATRGVRSQGCKGCESRRV